MRGPSKRRILNKMSARLLILALMASVSRAGAAPVEVVPRVTLGTSWAPGAAAVLAAPLSPSAGLAPALAAVPFSPSAPATQNTPIPQQIAPAPLVPELAPIPAAA